MISKRLKLVNVEKVNDVRSILTFESVPPEHELEPSTTIQVCLRVTTEDPALLNLERGRVVSLSVG